MAVMDAGRIRQPGTPVEVFRRPAYLLVTGFIGSTPMNLLEAIVDGGWLRVGGFRLPPPGRRRVAPGRRRAAGGQRPPEYAALADHERPGAIAGKVVLLESLGSAFLVAVEGDGVRGRVTIPEGRQPAVGTRRSWSPIPSACSSTAKTTASWSADPGSPHVAWGCFLLYCLTSVPLAKVRTDSRVKSVMRSSTANIGMPEPRTTG
jgi:ABC-type sugar transport system ATPase subunit